MSPTRYLAVLTASVLFTTPFGCSSEDGTADESPDTGAPSPSSTVPIGNPTLEDASAPTYGDAGVAPLSDAGPPCKKRITVIASVGTGASGTRSLSNGCWTLIDADGAANSAFRKCSTSNFQIKNPNAANYSYDDTNPTRALSQDQNYLSDCSQGASGDGYEFMAYRGSWRILSAPHLRAYFAELYGSETNDIDSFWKASGVYIGNAQLAGHKNVYPMINVGPAASAHLENKIHADTLALCKTIEDGGYFGTYVATYADDYKATDPRAIAVASALNTCTLPP